MAILNNLIVNGASRFLNKAYFSFIKSDKIGAEEGIFNKIVATTGDIGSLTVDDLTAGKATVLSLLDVRGELHTNQWTNSNIATVDGSFYITPTIGVDSGTMTTTTNSVTVNGSNFPISSLYVNGINSDNTAGTVAWTSGSKVLVTGEILVNGTYMPLGTLVGTLGSNVTASKIDITNITDNRAPYQAAASLAEIGTQSTALPCRNVKISLYQTSRSSTLYPLGIFMTALGENGKTFLDIYGGGYATSTATAGGFARPVLRIGNLAGLPTIGTQTPTGYGIYTSNGYFSGTVAARKGIIGDGATAWTIGSGSGTGSVSYIYAPTSGPTSKTANTVGMYVGTDGINNFKTTMQYVRIYDGKIYAQGANISGAITASSLTINSGATISGQIPQTNITNLTTDLATASTTASAYITDIDTNKGIIIKPRDASGNDFLQLNSDAISMYRNDVETLQITDSSIRVGKIGNNKRNIEITDYDVYIRNNTNILASYGADIHLYKPNSTSPVVTINNSGAIFDGTVNAASGKIGGFVIDDTSLHSLGKTSYNSTDKGIFLQSTLKRISTTLSSDKLIGAYGSGTEGSFNWIRLYVIDEEPLSELFKGDYLTVSFPNGFNSEQVQYNFHYGGDSISPGQTITKDDYPLTASYTNNTSHTQYIIYLDLHSSEYTYVVQDTNGTTIDYVTTTTLDAKFAIGASNGNHLIYDGTNLDIKISDNFAITSTGALTAKSGTIGGWNISASALCSATTYAPAASRILLAPAGVTTTSATGNLPAATYAITAGTDFGVTTAGKLYASGADISGNITATTGSISGSVTIGGTKTATTILNDISNAATTASNYISNISGISGISVHNINDEKNFVNMNSTDGVTIYRNINNVATDVARFGETVRVGKDSTQNGRMYINSNGVTLRSPTLADQSYSTLLLGAEGIDVGQYDGSVNISGQHISGSGFDNIIYSRKAQKSGENLNYFVSGVVDKNGFSIVHDKGTKPISTASQYHKNVELTDTHFRMEADYIFDDQFVPYMDYGLEDGDEFRLGLYDAENETENDYFSIDQEGNVNAAGILSAGAISSGLFSVVNVSISVSTSSAGAVANSKSVSKTGYFPLGIVGTSIETGGAYSRGFYLTNETNGSCTLNARLYASSSGTKNCNVNILWLKVTA